jgi:acyl-CoA ligase (AMP-forming) (exosortase A-associated)
VNFLVHHLLRASAQQYARHEALVHGEQRLSYAELWRRVSHLGHGLREAGVSRGDRVGVLLDPSTALAISLLGVSASGGVFVPIHHGLFAEQVEHIVCDCGMRGLILDAGRFSKLQPVLEGCPSLKFAVVVGAPAEQSTRLARHDFDTLCDGSAATPRDLAIDQDLAAILYTSGSTGKPKGVMLSHANLLAGAEIVADYLQITHDDRTLAVLPFSFDAGLNQLMTALYAGGTCVLIKFLFAKEIVAALAKERITGLAGVPSLWNLLAQDSSKLRDTPLEQLRYITNTGGALPLTVLARLREALPQTDVVLMYGLTEAFRSTYLPPEELDRRPTSMGKAIPNTEIFVVDEAGRQCGPGEVGELVHRGPTVSLGYWGHPELTAQVLRPDPFSPPQLSQPDIVCYSGDLVKTDEEGYLYFVGRRDNQIKSAGFRISPNEVEAALNSHASVREAAVIGLPDEVLGEHIKALVVAQNEVVVDTDALLEHVAEHLPRHMVPREVEVLDELPKTSSGKIDYPLLRRRETERLTP